jgi:hypothetical protein
MTPSNVLPVVANRQSAMTSLRASATIIVLRVPLRLSAVQARYHNAQRAVLLKHRKAPGELDHAAADPGVAGSGKPLQGSRQAMTSTPRFSAHHRGGAFAYLGPHHPWLVS